MTTYQRVAFEHPCLLACEASHPRYGHSLMGNRVSLTIVVMVGWPAARAGFDRPMWHASVSSAKKSDAELIRLCRLWMMGVGQLGLGANASGDREFWNDPDQPGIRGLFLPRCFHLQRAVSDDELAVLGPIRDIRGTPEALDRWFEVQRALPEHRRNALSVPE